jgi:tetratricopeptide (TPR) repeat protein
MRLGLIQQMISSCSYLLSKVDSQYSSGKSYKLYWNKLYNLYRSLGDAYWVSGNVMKSREILERSREIACLYGDQEAEVASLFNLGLCKEIIWETDEAILIYENVIALAEDTTFKRYAAQARYCLAYLYSCLDNLEKSKFYLDQIWIELSLVRIGIRSTGFRLYTVGFVCCYLKEFDKSLEMYNRAIEYADKGGFIQLKAISLTGLAILRRTQGEIEESLCILAEAIDLSHHVDVSHFCADAYYQLGLTYKLANNDVMADKSFEKAIYIFMKMEAPNQVEKVRQSMLSS